jgi:hypothetical protein
VACPASGWNVYITRLTTEGGATSRRKGEQTTTSSITATSARRRVVSAVSVRKAGTTPRYDARDSVNANGTDMRATSATHRARIVNVLDSSAMPPAMAIMSSR